MRARLFSRAIPRRTLRLVICVHSKNHNDYGTGNTAEGRRVPRGYRNNELLGLHFLFSAWNLSAFLPSVLIKFYHEMVGTSKLLTKFYMPCDY